MPMTEFVLILGWTFCALVASVVAHLAIGRTEPHPDLSDWVNYRREKVNEEGNYTFWLTVKAIVVSTASWAFLVIGWGDNLS